MQWHKLILALSIAGLLGGCSLNEAPKPAHVDLPELSDEVRVESKWWENYNDPILNELVEQALSANFDLRKAAANVSLAQATLSGADANRYPSINGAAGANRAKSSKEVPPFTGATGNSFSLSAVLSYELDVWGKIENTNASAMQSLLSSKATKDAVQIGLTSSVVDNYFGLLSLQAQQNIADETVQTRKESLDLVEEKYRLGALTSHEVLLAKSAYTNAKATQSSIKTAIARAQSALHVLIGTSPKELIESGGKFDEGRLPRPIQVPGGLSASLLEQRPDIQAALHALEAANLDIKVAKAAHFPSISLSGALGFSSAELGDLIGASARNWNIGGSLVAPLFDYGRIKSQVQGREALQEMARIGFESSVTRAFLEVYEAQSVRESIAESKQHALEQVKIYNELAKLSLNPLIDEVKIYQQSLSADISLIKALGGGWSKESLEALK